MGGGEGGDTGVGLPVWAIGPPIEMDGWFLQVFWPNYVYTYYIYNFFYQKFWGYNYTPMSQRVSAPAIKSYT